jgi:hypothetical protein
MQAGPAEDGTIYIALRATDGSFNNWFSAVPAMKKEMLATALSAMSMGKGVTASVTATTPYSVINRLYVVR